MNSTGRTAPDIKYAKNLPLKKHRMEELSAMLQSLQHNKESIAQNSYENLQGSYSEELKRLQEETEGLEKRIDDAIGRTNELNVTLQDEIKLFQKDLDEHDFLLSQSAISKEHFTRKKKDLDKKIRANEQSLRSNASLLDEASFYRNYVGTKTYLQHRAERFKEKGQQSLGNFSQGTASFMQPILTLFSRLSYKRIILYSIFLLLIIFTVVKFDRIKDEFAWRKAQLSKNCEAYDTYLRESFAYAYRLKAMDAREKCIWESLQDATMPSEINVYLNRYRNGKFIHDALSIQEKLTWDSIQAVDTWEAYVFYRNNFPDGIFANAAKDSINKRGTGTFTDPRDDMEYKWVRIGNQTWMAENLNVDKFCNGDPIPHAKSDEEWVIAGEEGKPAWCYYENDPENGAKYGKLYNWYAVNDPGGLAPEGWKIPSDEDWTQLTVFLGGEKVAGAKMKSTSGLGDGGYGTNESGFSGIPGGGRSAYGGYYNLGVNGIWWSSAENSTTHAWVRNLYVDGGGVRRGYGNKDGGFSVRCVRDN